MSSKGSTILNTITTTNILDNPYIKKNSAKLLLEASKQQNYIINSYDEKKIYLTSPDGIPVEFTTHYLDNLEYYQRKNDGEVPYTMEDLLRYVNEAPDLMKKNVDKIIFDYDPQNYLAEYGSVPYGTHDVYIGNKSLFYQNYNSPQNTLYHEMAHCMEDHPKLRNIPSMDWFKNLSETEKSSGYANATFDKNSKLNYENRYSENWADAFKIVAMHRTNPSMAVVSNPNGNQYSEPVSYAQWKRMNPNLDRVANTILDCKTDEDVFEVVRGFFYEFDRKKG